MLNNYANNLLNGTSLIKNMYKYCTIIIGLCLATNSMAMHFNNPYGKTYLHILAQDGVPNSSFRILINCPYVNINAQDNNGDTPLHSAVQGNSKDIIPLLLAKGADPDIENLQGITPLMRALKNELVNCAIALIEGGADTTYLYDPATHHPLLLTFQGPTPPNRKVTENYQLFVPVHSMVLHKELKIYKQQQKNGMLPTKSLTIKTT
jgi:ankyrin repeat protein